MKKNSNWRSALFTLRVSVILLCAVACSFASATLLAFFRPEAPAKVFQRTLTFEERLDYQRKIEEVYWHHRIWPKERTDAKPPLETVTSPRQIEKKVRDYLRNSRVLEDYWQQPISSQQLQAEMERMAQHTKNPEMLRELFEALGNDPFVIAESLARPTLSERLVNEFYEMNPKPVSEPQKSGRSRPHSLSAGSASDTATVAPAFTGYSLPALTSTASTCTDDTWSSLIDLPARRAGHSAVWTGSEMIVWGGFNYDKPLGTGDRYNPATDSWSKVSLTNAPTTRSNHTSVWTGTKMIVWGGYNGDASGGTLLNSGGKYDPANDSWTPTSTSNAPTARLYHTALWTGTVMLIWGGQDATSLPTTGGRYNPNTDSWTTMSTTNAPGGRYQQSAVWTGSAMIIWGGRNGPSSYLNSGAKYNPTSNTWTTTGTTNAPGARFGHSAVWTGSGMIIWGGWNGTVLGDGATYNAATDNWVALSASNPPAARFSHSAVWTGSEMIVWGGIAYPQSDVNSGSRYNQATNTWTPTSLTNAPQPADTNTGTTIWTGSEMIVFGGGYGETFDTGARYDPSADTWTRVRTTNTPDGRYRHTAVWTGSEMVVWGGDLNSTYETNTGAQYDPALDAWTPTTTVNAPQGREAHTAVWTGKEMIVWGGWYSDGESIFVLNTGGRYNPASDTWIPTTLTNAPNPARWHTAVWTGSEMIVWGGEAVGVNGLGPANTGGRYNPKTDSWVATGTTNAPAARIDHTAVWTGSEMIVWGGGPYTATNTGGRYNPLTDGWTATSTTGTSARSAHSAIWTGNEMIVWGGYNGSIDVNTGARYNPGTDTWTATSTVNGPDGRATQAAVWTGNEMIVWGGYNTQEDRFFNNGGRYNPGTDSWTATTTSNSPKEAEYPTAVWTGSQMIVFGGLYAFYDSQGHYTLYLLSTGGRYCASSATAVQAAVSRETHGAAGSFDVNLPLTGTPGIECRSGGTTNDHTMVVTFAGNVTVNGNPQAAVTSGTGTIGSGGMSNGGTVTINKNVVTIPLTNVANAQTINVTLYSVNSSTNVVIPMSVLTGDTNADTFVDSADIAQTKSKSGQTTNTTNFREDINTDGFLDSADIAFVKSKSGMGLTATPASTSAEPTETSASSRSPGLVSPRADFAAPRN
jgi:N-acetylneuraminic acid mutarotase